MSTVKARLWPILCLFVIHAGSAAAQQADRPPNLKLGDAVITGFSGTIAPAASKKLPRGKTAIDLTFINPDGPSARIIDVSRPGYVWDGRLFAAPKTFDVLAKDVGQVFGVALDDAAQPNIYVAATSAFGLNIVKRGRDGQPERMKKGGPGAGWMKGQFGLDLQGGPGAIYKIDGRTGAPTLFANVTLDGVPNAAAGLGNLAYDAAHKQLFVSDLYTGMIHRFDLEGKELSRYDHGVTGREAAKLAAVPFDPKNRPNIASDRFNPENPSTWGFAPAARQVWGLAVHEGRLYYSVVSGPQIWSVGIARDGSFAADPRWELDVPAQAGPLPISDIAFSNKGAMILAQRALIAGAYDYSAMTRPGEPQVFRIWLKGPKDPPSPGRWKITPEEYAVGFAGNYRNTNGGIALGYGYGQDGTARGDACEFSLWTTGQNLRNAPSLKTRLDPGGPLVVHGIQGLPASPVRDVNTPPWLSYTVAYGDRADSARAIGHMGSVRIYTKPCNAFAVYSGPGYPASPPYIVSVVGPPPRDCRPNCPPSDNPIDIGIAKIGEVNVNNPDGPYNFTIGVRNLAGPIATAMPLTFTDVVPAGMTFTSITGNNYTCLPVAPVSGGTTLTCTYTGTFPIAANQILGSVAIVADGGNGPYENCAKLGQTDHDPSNDKACVTVRKDYGNFTVVKEIENFTDPHISTAGLVYPVAVTCGSTVTNLNLVDGMPQTVGPTPYNTLCKVVEGTAPLPTAACPAGHLAWRMPQVYLPSDSVTIVSGINATVRVHNTLECVPDGGGDGSLTVTKTVINKVVGGPSLGGLAYPVTVTCGGQQTSLVLTEGMPQAVYNIPLNTSCHIQEGTLPAVTGPCAMQGEVPTWSTAYLPSQNVPVPGLNTPVTVQNTLECKPPGSDGNTFTVTKEVINHTDPQIPTTGTVFAISASCVSGMSPAVVTPMPLQENGSQTINGLALGAVCTVSETPPAPPPIIAVGCSTPGTVPVWTTVLPAPVTITGSSNSALVRNILDCVPPNGGGLGSLTVTKTAVIHAQGTLSTAGLSYPISVSCASGGSPAVVTNLSLTENIPQTVSNIALNSSCTVSETTPMPTPTGACAAVGAVPTWTMPPTFTPAAPVTVNGTNVSMTVQNTLECKPSGTEGGSGGNIQVQKMIEDNRTFTTSVSTNFPITVTCGSTVVTADTYQDTVTSVTGLPTGVACSVSETLPPPPTNGCQTGFVPAWGLQSYIPATVQAASGVGPLLTVKNVLNCVPSGGGGTGGNNGYLLVQKEIKNNTQATPATLAGLTFPAIATCGSTPTSLTLTVSAAQVVHNIPFNDVCTVAETLPAPPTTGCTDGKVPTWQTPPDYTPANATIEPGPGKTIVVRNTLNCELPGGGGGGGGGSLVVQKQVTNDTPAANVTGLVFPATVSCVSGMSPAAVTNLTLSEATPQTINNIALGSVCTVSETLPPAPSAGCVGGPAPTWVNPPVYTPATVTIGTTPSIIVVHNTLKCELPPHAPQKPALKCRPPLVANSNGTDCVCPAGKTRRGKSCVERLVCREPAHLNSRGTACICPRGMVLKGNTCVERERERPRVRDEIIRALPGLIGPGGFGGGGGGRPRGGGGSEPSGGGAGGYTPGKR